MAELEGRVTELEVAFGKHEVRIDSLEKSRDKGDVALEGINRELRSLREDYAHRPTWVVAIVITIMTTLIGMMSFYIITNLGKVVQ